MHYSVEASLGNQFTLEHVVPVVVRVLDNQLTLFWFNFVELTLRYNLWCSEKHHSRYKIHFSIEFSVFTYILHLLCLFCWFSVDYIGVGNIHLPTPSYTPAYTRLHLEKIIQKHLFLCRTKARKRGQWTDIDSVSCVETICFACETKCFNGWNKMFQHFLSIVNTLLFNRLSLSLGLFPCGIALKGVGMKARM